jgi:hypothetical protein
MDPFIFISQVSAQALGRKTKDKLASKLDAIQVFFFGG